jgi:hypothetical protein
VQVDLPAEVDVAHAAVGDHGGETHRQVDPRVELAPERPVAGLVAVEVLHDADLRAPVTAVEGISRPLQMVGVSMALRRSIQLMAARRSAERRGVGRRARRGREASTVGERGWPVDR